MDGRRIKVILILAAGIFLAVNSGRSTLKLWMAGSRLAEAEKVLSAAKEENVALKDKLGEVESEEFVEREARNKLGMAREGETIVVLPQEERNSNPQMINSQKEMPNWEKWRKLYFGAK